MKKTGKTLLIIALCLVVVGTAMTVTAAAFIWSNGLVWEDGRDTYAAREMFEEWDGVNSLELALFNEPVSIVRGGDAVRVEWSQRYDGQYGVYREGGTLTLKRETFHRNRRWGIIGFGFDIDWLGGLLFGAGSGDIENGYDRPVTISVPEGLDLGDIEINGVDVNVIIDNITARDINVNGANARVEFFCANADDYDFETNGLGSSLTIDGDAVGWGAGHAYSGGGTNRSVTVNGANAVLDVTTTGN
ncbi:MAG: hypothetical protein LBR76_04750 [Oscillospiraceae bacterium]|jgi:hypothetical protein|nr:hypothetical protein [Oscillospiraceae bacterium]